MTTTNAVPVKDANWILQANWRVINDAVMGGMSQSTIKQHKNHLNFSGIISLENNGGFASTRSELTLDTHKKDKLNITVKGDDKVYQLRLRVDRYFDGPAFVVEFIAKSSQWTSYEFSADDFTLQFRGKPFASDYQLNFSDLTTIGFLISSQQQGEFSLNIKKITFD